MSDSPARPISTSSGEWPSPSEIAFQVQNGFGAGRSGLASAFLNSEEFNIGGRFSAGLYVGLLNRDAEFGGWLFQFFYMDGGKIARANVHYFDRVAPFLSDGAVFMLDDVDYSRQMQTAWAEICSGTGFSFTVDAGRGGWGLWSGEGTKRAGDFELFRAGLVNPHRLKRIAELRGEWFRR